MRFLGLATIVSCLGRRGACDAQPRLKGVPGRYRHHPLNRLRRISCTIFSLDAGFAGGASGVVGGQPLDTLRIRLQQHVPGGSSTVRIWQTMTANEGWRSLFKGMSYPLLASGVQVILSASTCAPAVTDLLGG